MAIQRNPAADYPQVASSAYVHPTATILGKVVIADRVFIGPNAVVRADEPGPDGTVQPIVIGEGVNLQDGVVVHALGGTGVTIGPRTSIAHCAVIHGPCRIGEACFVGFNSVIYHATLGSGTVVKHLAVIEDVDIPEGRYVPTMTHVATADEVRRLAPVTPELTAFAEKVYRTNLYLAEGM